MDIPFARKVLEFVEIEHDDTVHRQKTFYWSPAMEESWRFRYRLPSYYDQGCKTAACICGTAVMLSPNAEIAVEYTSAVVMFDGRMSCWTVAGKQLLGITDDQAQVLFYEMDDKKAIGILRDYIEQAEAEEVAGNEV